MRPRVTATRYVPGPRGDRDGSFYKWITPSGLQLYAGSLPWRKDAKDLSCLPPDPESKDEVVFLAEFLLSPIHKVKIYHLTKMLMPDGSWGPLPDGRTVVEIHNGNLCGDVVQGALSQVLGCYILGNAIGTFKAGQAFKCADEAIRKLPQDQEGVTGSVDALQRFEADMEYQSFELAVVQGTEILS